MLTEIGAGTGDDDADELRIVVAAQLRSLGTATEFDRPLGTADTSFTVGDHRQKW